MKSSNYLWCALFVLAAGIITGAAYPFPPAPALAVSLIASMVAVFRLARPDPRHGCLAWLAAMLLFGLAAGTSRLQQTGPAWIGRWRGQTLHFEGWVDGFEERLGGGFTRTAVRVTHVDGQRVEPARVQITIASGGSFPDFGAGLQGTGRLNVFEGPANPGDPDPRLTSRIRGLVALIEGAAFAPVSGRFRPGSGIVRAAVRVRKALERVGERSLPQAYAALLNGITLGESGSLDKKWRLAFQRSGTLHILSVSGLHVGLVSSAAYWLLRRKRVPLSWVMAAVALCTGLYVVMTGLKPPGIRSGMMAVTSLAGNAAGRKVPSVRLLGVAAVAMLAFDPLLLFDASFQLSVAATAGVCYAAPLFQQAFAKGFWARAGQLLACSLGAQIAVAPWQAYYFNTATPAALLANLLIVPLATSALYTGFTASLAGLLWLPLARWLNGGTCLILRLMIGSAQCAAAIPFGSFDVPAPTPVFFVLYYAAVVAVLLRIRHGVPFRGGKAILTLLLPGALWIACTGTGWFEPSRVTFLDVGQGSAALVEFRSGELGVIDGGPARDGTRGVLLKAIARKGRKRVDFMILSHAHSDHYQGLLSVLDAVRVDRLVVPQGVEEGREVSRMLNLARRNKVKVVPVTAGMGLRTRSGTCHILWPLPGYQGDENGRSLVVLIEEAGFRVMLPGDVARKGLEWMMGRYGRRVQCDVWAVPHHGSISAYCPDFYGLARPALSVISVGVNRYGHPAPRVVGALKSAPGDVSDTRSSGAVVVTLRRSGILVTEWRKRGLFGLYMWRGNTVTRSLRIGPKKGSKSF